jgi:hypothetical protein
VLKPQQITFVADMLMQHGLYNNFVPGTFVSALINKSYQAGHTNFFFDTKDRKMPGLCDHLKADEERPLIVKAIGDADWMFGAESSFCKFILLGNADFCCGHKAENCDFNVYGNASCMTGMQAKNCKFIVKGNADTQFGHEAENSWFEVNDVANNCFHSAKSSYFRINGKAGDDLCPGVSAENCTFVTPNIETYEKIVRGVKNGGKNNKVTFEWKKQ